MKEGQFLPRKRDDTSSSAVSAILAQFQNQAFRPASNHQAKPERTPADGTLRT